MSEKKKTASRAAGSSVIYFSADVVKLLEAEAKRREKLAGVPVTVGAVARGLIQKALAQ